MSNGEKLVPIDVPDKHPGVILDLPVAVGELVETVTADTLRETGKISSPNDTTYLRFVHAVELPATAGTTTIARSVRVFTGFLSKEFRNRGTDVPGHDTNLATALVYELTRDGAYARIFESLGENWRARLLTQGQIVAFCREHSDSLRLGGYGNFFPFQVEGLTEIFVARVDVVGGQLKVNCDYLTYDYGGWAADELHRVVVLQ